MATTTTARTGAKTPAQTDPLDTTTVGDLMHPGIVSCSQDAGAADIARIMATCRVHCVAIIGLSKQDRGDPVIWGIVSDLDLLEAAAAPGDHKTAADLAHQPVISIRPDRSARTAAEAMVTHGVQHLVVVDPQRQAPVGVLSTLDIARQIADTPS
jgi:CBS domain-containing protein